VEPTNGKPLAAGKLPFELLVELLRDDGPIPSELLLGARIGEDACAIDVPAGALIAAADPITLTSEDSGRLAVLVNANDVAVTGARPRWFMAVVLVPPGTDEQDVRELFRSIRRALAEAGAHLVGGHTEVTDAVCRPVVVGQMLGMAEDARVVTTAGLAAGDVLVQVRPAPIEGAAVLAREARRPLSDLDPSVLSAARDALDQPGISVVEPAILASRMGATALHDPTEGGFAGGLHEMARAAGLRVVVERKRVLWFEPGVEVCRRLGADPWGTLASGTLLAAFPPEGVDEALAAFARERHAAAVVGYAEPGAGVMDTEGSPIEWPARDEVARLLAGKDDENRGATI
jgi:hydrogenase maturation factor